MANAILQPYVLLPSALRRPARVPSTYYILRLTRSSNLSKRCIRPGELSAATAVPFLQSSSSKSVLAAGKASHPPPSYHPTAHRITTTWPPPPSSSRHLLFFLARANADRREALRLARSSSTHPSPFSSHNLAAIQYARAARQSSLRAARACVSGGGGGGGGGGGRTTIEGVDGSGSRRASFLRFLDRKARLQRRRRSGLCNVYMAASDHDDDDDVDEEREGEELAKVA